MKDPYKNYDNKFITLADLKVDAGLPKRLEFGGDKFVIKPEFHITLLNIGRLAELIDKIKTEELMPEIVEEFYRFVEKQPLKQYLLSDDLRLVKVADNNKTIVVMAELEGIDGLFKVLSKKYDTELPVQPTHVTLYTLQTDTFGIPINSYEQLSEISKPVELLEINKLLESS